MKYSYVIITKFLDSVCNIRWEPEPPTTLEIQLNTQDFHNKVACSRYKVPSEMFQTGSNVSIVMCTFMRCYNHKLFLQLLAPFFRPLN